MQWEIHKYRNISWPDLEKTQERIIEEVRNQPEKAFLIVSEPKPTFTFGRSSDPKDRLWSQEILEKRGMEAHGVTRGGKWTYHGPGQIVIYPVVKLKNLGYEAKEVRRFMSDLKLGVRRFLEDLDLNAQEKPDKPFGLYINGLKITSFGIAITHGISSHGLALYLTNQKDYFSGINPCGVKGEKITSLEEQGRKISWEQAFLSLTAQIKKGFQRAKS